MTEESEQSRQDGHRQDRPLHESQPPENRLRDAILEAAIARGAEKTICPSEVARALGGPHPDGWGPLMVPIRRAAVALAFNGRIVIYRKGKPVDPADFRGVYRIGLPRQD